MSLSEKEMQDLRGHVISMIFQDPMTALNPVKTVSDQIAEVVQLHSNAGKAKAMERAKEMLGMVGISVDRAGEYPHQFSGGMKQRVVIAMALACNPALLIADEPTTALDVTIQAQVLDMIKNLREEFNTSMIMITHDLGVVAETCDAVAVTYAGKIIEYGTLADVFDHPSHPYTVGLFHALPDMNKGSNRLAPIDGLPPDPTNLPAGCAFSPRCPYACDACRQHQIPAYNITQTHYCRCIRCKPDGPHRFQQRLVHAQQVVLDPVGIADDAALIDIGAAWHGGQRRADAAAGAAFGGDQGLPPEGLQHLTAERRHGRQP